MMKKKRLAKTISGERIFAGIKPCKYFHFNTKDIGMKFQTLYVRVLAYVLSLILHDIVEDNVTFYVPNSKDIIHMQACKYGDETYEHLSNGILFKDVDYLASNFTIYYPCYSSMRRNGKMDNAIYYGPIQKRIVELTNQGKGYG